MKKLKTEKITLMGMLSALALALSALEGYLMPNVAFLPPGAKPGLSNIITVFACSFVSPSAAFLIVLIKAVFALITRGVTAFAMSFVGGLLSAAVMIIMLKYGKGKISFIGIGVVCAVMHNLGQLSVSFVMTQTAAIVGYAPYLLLFGIITGLVTGSILKVTVPAIEKVIKK